MCAFVDASRGQNLRGLSGNCFHNQSDSTVFPQNALAAWLQALILLALIFSAATVLAAAQV